MLTYADVCGRMLTDADVCGAGEAGWFGGSKSWVPFPRSGSVFNYYFDTLELTWKPWAEAQREFRYL